MKSLFKLIYYLFTPVLAIIYWRNSIKELKLLASEREMSSVITPH
jgi:hypothetical protein